MVRQGHARAVPHQIVLRPRDLLAAGSRETQIWAAAARLRDVRRLTPRLTALAAALPAGRPRPAQGQLPRGEIAPHPLQIATPFHRAQVAERLLARSRLTAVESRRFMPHMSGRRCLALLLATRCCSVRLPSAAADPAPIDWQRVAEDAPRCSPPTSRSTPRTRPARPRRRPRSWPPSSVAPASAPRRRASCRRSRC